MQNDNIMIRLQCYYNPPTNHVIISCLLYPTPSTRVLFTMSYINIVLNIIPTLYEGYIVSVHRMVMENRPVDPGSIQESLTYILHKDKI